MHACLVIIMLHASLKCSETASLSYWKTIFLSIFLKIWSLSPVYSLWTSVRNPSKFYQNLRTVSWKTNITFSMMQYRYFCLPSEALHLLSAAIQMTDAQPSAGLTALQRHDSISTSSSRLVELPPDFHNAAASDLLSSQVVMSGSPRLNIRSTTAHSRQNSSEQSTANSATNSSASHSWHSIIQTAVHSLRPTSAHRYTVYHAPHSYRQVRIVTLTGE